MKYITLIVWLLFFYISPAASANDYAVIVGHSNQNVMPQSAAEEEIRQIYLGWKLRWDDNQIAYALAPPTNSPAYNAFRDSILKMTQAEEKKHWERAYIIHEKTPPKTISRERLLINLVANTAGAFSIVHQDIAMKHRDKVKVLFSFGPSH